MYHDDQAQRALAAILQITGVHYNDTRMLKISQLARKGLKLQEPPNPTDERSQEGTNIGLNKIA